MTSNLLTRGMPDGLKQGSHSGSDGRRWTHSQHRLEARSLEDGIMQGYSVMAVVYGSHFLGAQDLTTYVNMGLCFDVANPNLSKWRHWWDSILEHHSQKVVER
jgi:hypothetical protein